ncbi:CAP domain-containing protein [Vannielia litorea]|uniref:Cysteine-rich secretory protein family protein n=1 Tax=Vannielia litorea TaxID=1217970 RepID=A0A1N6EG38_9RHOB|nr:CAP domain-containing protein [Vannielia litorea]SIN81979.1 Cysteine-rich secretory protein family protein [Vannielia litorea]
MKRALLTVGLLALAACAAPSPTAPSAPRGGASFDSAFNAYRASRGRGTVAANAGLTRIAEAHARDMDRNGYFAHRGRDGASPAQRMGRAGCGGLTAENIAGGYPSESAVLAGWKRSSGHNANLLRRGIHHYGLGRSGNLWVLVLAETC